MNESLKEACNNGWKKDQKKNEKTDRRRIVDVS
jgi:hypothetical protein